MGSPIFIVHCGFVCMFYLKQVTLFWAGKLDDVAPGIIPVHQFYLGGPIPFHVLGAGILSNPHSSRSEQCTFMQRLTALSELVSSMAGS